MRQRIDAISALAGASFREAVRSKIFVAVITFAILLVAVAACFGLVSIGDQIKVIKDFGLFAIGMATSLFVVISGATQLHKELARKTVYNVLSKPMRRGDFVVGKFLGLYATSLCMLGVMIVLLGIFTALLEGKLDAGLFLAAFLMSFANMILCGIVILFSAVVVTPILVGLFAFGIFLAGRSAEYLLYFIEHGTAVGLNKLLLEALYAVLPNFDALSITDGVIYGILPEVQFIGWAVLYSVSYSLMVLVLGIKFFERRDFN